MNKHGARRGLCAAPCAAKQTQMSENVTYLEDEAQTALVGRAFGFKKNKKFFEKKLTSIFLLVVKVALDKNNTDEKKKYIKASGSP